MVVAHGGVLRAGAGSFLGLPREKWHVLGALGNCAWSVLECNAHQGWVQWRITEWNAPPPTGGGLGVGEPLR